MTKQTKHEARNPFLKGIAWALILFFLLRVVRPSLSGVEINTVQLLKSFIAWLLLGVIFGFVIKIFDRNKTDKD